MKVKQLLIVMTAAATVLSGCVKETYDMKKLSRKVALSPTLAVAAANGELSFSDVVKANDTIIFGSDKFVRVIFKKDSVIDFRMADVYDLNDMVSFNQTYTVGEMSLAPFSGGVSYTLRNLALSSAPAVTLVNGATQVIPAFTASPGDKALTPFSNFENATFSEGFLDITIRNNLPVTINSITIRVYNTTGHTKIGNDIVISSVAPGQTGVGSLNLTNLTISNSLTVNATVTTAASGAPVLINLDGSSIAVEASGRSMKVKSGRIVIPAQTITSLDNKDTIDFDPGTGIEVTNIKISTGQLSYTIKEDIPLKSTVTITVPTSSRGGVPVSETIVINPNTVVNGTISLNNTTIDLNSVTAQPYNKLPLNYGIEVSSNNSLVNFSSTNEVSLNISLSNPTFDYVKGYFGQEGETIDPETLDLEIKDLLANMTASFLISNPIIRLNYSNSFAIPVNIDLKASGFRGVTKVDLGLSPFNLSYPAAPAERDKTGTFTIDRNNSKIADLVSMPPEKIEFSGSAKMNPLGSTGARDNYIFGNSRFLGNLEVEVPLEFRINNIQFADTIDNFFSSDSSEVAFKPEDFKYLRTDFNVENGFPLGISIKLSLYDSKTKTKKATIDATDILKPAPTGTDGRATAPAVSATSIEITQTFWSDVSDADQIIISFALNTTDNGTKDVKIYSDYKIKFNVALVVKPELSFN